MTHAARLAAVVGWRKEDHPMPEPKTLEQWTDVLRKVEPRGKEWIILGLADNMPDLIHRFEIDTDLRQQHFIAQCAHESDHFQTTQEYASGSAYNGRKDLGNTHPGDGPRFKGRGLIQLTGRFNYTKAAEELGDPDILNKPETVERFPPAAIVSGWFWRKNNLNAVADRDDPRAVCKIVNGGLNGLDSRIAALKACKSAFA
jgi:putative chitinase